MIVRRALLLMVTTVLMIGFTTPPAQALWLSGYEYRKQITLDGSDDGNLTNYQLLLNVYNGTGTDSGNSVYLSSIKDDFSDIRFTNSAGTELDYWIESYTSGNNAKVWIEFDSIPASPDSAPFYIYYDNVTASSDSNGANTFQFFDDFSGSSLNTQWNDTVGTPNISGGELVLDPADKIRSTGSSYLSERVRYHIKQSTTTAKGYLGLSQAALTSGMWTDDYIATSLWGTGDVYKDTGNDGNYYSTIIGGGYSANTYYLHEMTLTVSEVKYYINDTYKENYIDRIPDESMYPRIENMQGGTGIFYVDWYSVGQFTANEPSFESWGSQEEYQEEELIPEPASLLLFGFGIIGTTLFSQQRRTKI